MSKSKINFPVIIILMTVLLDSMGIGIMIPVMPELFKSVLPKFHNRRCIGLGWCIGLDFCADAVSVWPPSGHPV